MVKQKGALPPTKLTPYMANVYRALFLIGIIGIIVGCCGIAVLLGIVFFLNRMRKSIFYLPNVDDSHHLTMLTLQTWKIKRNGTLILYSQSIGCILLRRMPCSRISASMVVCWQLSQAF
jgi:hypothetical protein